MRKESLMKKILSNIISSVDLHTKKLFSFSLNDIILKWVTALYWEEETRWPKQKNFFTKNESEEIFQRARNRIIEMINGPGSSGGYRSVWHSLEMEGLRIPRVVVQDLLKELDADGVKARKAHRLKRRVYRNPGTNYSWHIDGYDKLKPWGFPIHGAIDGFSRRILWLHVTRSNNSPDNIATFYLNTVKELGGCPVELVTDLGTENAIVAGAQSYFRDNSDSHRYVASPRNQQIEGWWSFFCKNRSNWWRTFFQDLEYQHFWLIFWTK